MVSRKSYAVLEDILSKVDLAELIGESVALKQAGEQWKSRCPFHGEETPSFTVFPAATAFHCFGCGCGGDAFSFVVLQYDVSFGDAVRIVARRVGMELPLNWPREPRPADE